MTNVYDRIIYSGLAGKKGLQKKNSSESLYNQKIKLNCYHFTWSCFVVYGLTLGLVIN